MAIASKGHLSLTNKGMKTSGLPSSFVKLFHNKKTFFLLQMNASLRFQVSGACSASNFLFWAKGAQFMCLPKTLNIIIGHKLGLNPPPGSQTLMTTRVFKLVRHFAGLQSLLHTLQQAYQVLIRKCWPRQKKGDSFPLEISNLDRFQELGLLLVLVAVAILTYSSLVYFAGFHHSLIH